MQIIQGMQLDDYLREKGESLRDFAKRAGLDLSTLYRIRNGQHDRASTTIKKIVAATDGKVTANDLIFPAALKKAPVGAAKKARKKVA
jgi:predicted transcriptional regulator